VGSRHPTPLVVASAAGGGARAGSQAGSPGCCGFPPTGRRLGRLPAARAGWGREHGFSQAGGFTSADSVPTGIPEELVWDLVSDIVILWRYVIRGCAGCQRCPVRREEAWEGACSGYWGGVSSLVVVAPLRRGGSMSSSERREEDGDVK
jgi:hypothetical protein